MASALASDLDQLTHLFRGALLCRAVDEKMYSLSKQNKGGAFHLFTSGHEFVGYSFGRALQMGDYGFPYYRDRAFAIGKGAILSELFATFLARDCENHSGGRMMPDHFSSKECNIPAQSSVVGTQFLQAAGVALGMKLRGEKGVVYVSAGDGATSQGDFHEMLNLASIHSLPLLVVIQNNGWAISVPSHEQTAGSNPALFGAGYAGLKTYTVDGSDLFATHGIAEDATAYVREHGPALVVAKVPRLGPHSSSDDPTKYKETSEVDPFEKTTAFFVDNGIDVESLKAEVKGIVQAAAELGETAPLPRVEPMSAFKESKMETAEGEYSEPMVMMDALNSALSDAMEEDERVLVFGQDVAHGKGGVFGITRGLTSKFGNRCFNTPLAESTIIGMAIGLAMYGFIPVVEIQFCDYIWTGLNQLCNEASSLYFRSNGQWNLPIVIRMPFGGYIQGGPYHSQCLETLYSHIPGLKVVAPSNSNDAKRLLLGAIKDPNPVVFLEHKALYRQRSFAAQKVQGGFEPLECAKTLQRGSDVTIISYSYLLGMIVDIVREESIDADIIDLRVLAPLDKEAIAESVSKTGKVLIVHEAVKTLGLGSEISAYLSEELFTELDAPIMRVGAKDLPVPYDKGLESAVLPSREAIKEKLFELLEF